MLLKIKKFLLKILYPFEPLTRIAFNLIYLVRLSKWCKDNPIPAGLNHIKGKKTLTRYDLYEYILKNERLRDQPVNYLEFGVYKGDSLRWWSENLKNPQSRFFGFDTFTGLPEQYRNLRKGAFSTGGNPPEINDDRVSYEVGLFSETLSPFLEKTNTKRKTVVNFDADLYSSSLYVLTSLVPRLARGSVIIFDEFSGSFGEHEFRAFMDFLSAYPVKFVFLGAAKDYIHVAFRLI